MPNTGPPETGQNSENNEKSPSFEAALARLEEIVHRLERGEITLDESLSAFKEGSDLVRLCLDRLSAAEKAVQQLMAGEGGGLALKNSDLNSDIENGAEEGQPRRSGTS